MIIGGKIIPNTMHLGSMGVSSNYAGIVNLNDSQPKDEILIAKIENVKAQTENYTRSLIKKDNGPHDKNPEKGEISVEQTGPRGEQLNTMVHYDPVTGAPISKNSMSGEGAVSGHSRWNRNGDLVRLFEMRYLDDHAEIIEINHDTVRGVIAYSEKYIPKALA